MISNKNNTNFWEMIWTLQAFPVEMWKMFWKFKYVIIPPLHRRGVYCFTSVHPSVQDIFRRIFLSNYCWQKSDIWSQASYRYAILWEAFLDPSDSYFLFADLVVFYTHWTFMWGYHKWALAHSSSYSICIVQFVISNKWKKLQVTMSSFMWTMISKLYINNYDIFFYYRENLDLVVIQENPDLLVNRFVNNVIHSLNKQIFNK